MRRKLLWKSIVVGLIILGAGYIAWPTNPTVKIFKFEKSYKLVQGLDLKGGMQLTYELDLSKTEEGERGNAIDSVINVLDKRVNGLGVAEPLIQQTKIGGKEAVNIELPGVTDSEKAIDTIGKTAKLEFKQQNPQADEQNPDSLWLETGLTGAQLKRATIEFDPNDNKPIIGLEFKEDGAKLFEEITANNISKPLAIFLDDELLQAPNVNEKITGGKATISGQFSLQEVKNTVNLLNSGALPVPLTLTEQRNIGATLGEESVKKSLVAGLLGLVAIGLFMISYYRFLGVIAVIALIIYSAISIAVFKLIPVTLTLSGIAGFILSIGMAVDANILIFERMKEELRAGHNLDIAISEGFKRAWNSIRDSNASSIITALILFKFTSGSVKGFALTLMIGILISMFSAITVSRTLLQLFALTKMSKFLRGGVK